MASAGCRKKAGVPVLDRVAAILRQMMPDLPIPVTITRPVQSRSITTACAKRSSRRSMRPRMASASVRSTFRASARSGMHGSRHHASFTTASIRIEPAEQRFEAIQRDRVLRVAHRPRRFLVHLEKHAVHPCAHARRRERLDVLAESRGHAVAAAGQLEAVRHVEDHRPPQLAHHRKRAHVDHEVVVAEREAALRDEHARVARRRSPSRSRAARRAERETVPS